MNTGRVNRVSLSRHRPLAPLHQQAGLRRLCRVTASSPQPLADVARGLPGAGRLARQAVESITNPKDQKHRHQEREQREQARQQQQQQQELEQQQQEQQDDQQIAEAAQTAAIDHIESAAAELADAATAGTLAAAPEAVAVAGTQQQRELSEYTEEEAPAKTIQERYHDTVRFLTSSTTGKGISIAAGLFLGATLLIALYRTYQKYSSPRAQRKRVIDKNKQLVDELSKYLPDNRAGLTPGVVRRLRGLTGFSPVEVFRKYLWFMLRERKFDVAAVEDMTLLKTVLGLTDEQAAEALKERAQRIYDKYGTLMLNTEGVTAEGIERKATCRALFSKLLYLVEYEPLVAQGSEAFKITDLRMIFGATDEDTEKLRIVSLYDIDIEHLDAMMRGGSGKHRKASVDEQEDEQHGKGQQGSQQ